MRSRKLFLFAAALTSAAGSLVGCGSSDESDPSSDGGAGGEVGAGTGGQGGDGGAAGGSEGGAGAGGAGGSSGEAGSAGQTGTPTACDESFTITSSQEYAVFAQQQCTSVTGNLRITQTDLEALDGLVLERVEGELTIAANPELEDLSGLATIEHIGGSLLIVNNASLITLVPLLGWPEDAVGGNLSIFSNAVLPQCEVENLDAHLTANCDNCANNDGNGSCE